MKDSDANNNFGLIIKILEKKMKYLGYRYSRSNFWQKNTDVFTIINLQKSVSSSSTNVSFTINIGVIVLDLCRDKMHTSRVPSIWDSHLRIRIGHLMEENKDKWWEVSKDTDACIVGLEILDLIERYVDPYLQKFRCTDDILALWEMGKSPGITTKNRNDFIKILKSFK